MGRFGRSGGMSSWEGGGLTKSFTPKTRQEKITHLPLFWGNLPMFAWAPHLPMWGENLPFLFLLVFFSFFPLREEFLYGRPGPVTSSVLSPPQLLPPEPAPGARSLSREARWMKAGRFLGFLLWMVTTSNSPTKPCTSNGGGRIHLLKDILIFSCWFLEGIYHCPVKGTLCLCFLCDAVDGQNPAPLITLR